MKTLDLRAHKRTVNKGITLIEVLIYLAILSSLSISGAKTTQALIHKSRVSLLLAETETLIKASIASSRISQNTSQIFLVSTGKSNSIQDLVFMIEKRELGRISLPSTLISGAEIRSSSIFKDHIEIQPNGYTTPSSIKLSLKRNVFNKHHQALIYISRLGNVRSEWQS
jgi:Tfp pilus assembly protein FimT